MNKVVIFKVGDAEIRIEGKAPQMANMSVEGVETMTINNAISALNKSFGFDVQKQFPNIRDTAVIQ